MRDGIVVPLNPKAAETLLALLANSGRVCSKEDLVSSIWPHSFVQDTSLAQNISQIRKALGENSDCQFIKTVPKRGYMFVAAVSTAPPTSRTPGSARVTSERQIWTPRGAIGSVFTLVLLVAVGWALVRTGRREARYEVHPFTTYPGEEYEPSFAPRTAPDWRFCGTEIMAAISTFIRSRFQAVLLCA